MIDATNDLELGSNIKLMPNPANEYLEIQSEIQLDEIRVYNFNHASSFHNRHADRMNPPLKTLTLKIYIYKVFQYKALF